MGPTVRIAKGIQQERTLYFGLAALFQACLETLTASTKTNRELTQNTVWPGLEY